MIGSILVLFSTDDSGDYTFEVWTDN
jgi:hypothetical protein